MNGGVNTYNNIRNTSNKKVLAEKLLYGNDSQWSIFLSNQRNKKDITSNEVFDNLIQILKIIKQYNKVLSNVWVDNNITLFKNIVKLFNKLQNNNNIIYLFRILKFNEDWYDSILNLPENKKKIYLTDSIYIFLYQLIHNHVLNIQIKSENHIMLILD